MIGNFPHTKPKYLNHIEDIKQISPGERDQLAQVAKKYRFRTNEYYLSLIDWDDHDDPIRRLILPDPCELERWGNLDPSNEQSFTILPGLEHKYASTALLLVSNVCGGICRYCFRKRVFISSHGQILTDLPAALDYIEEHEEITNVLLTGGDPLVLATHKLAKYIKSLCQIDHVKIIRIGTKMPAFNPYRIIEDPVLLELIAEANSEKQVYIMTHFNHSRELTSVAVKAIKALHRAGAVLANQTPLIRGVNDDPQVMANLFRDLSFCGVPPYYVFQCRPASGNKDYAVPVEEGYYIFEQAKAQVSGLAKRAHFVMSHISGKIEILAVTNGHIYLKYHRAAEDEESGSFMVFESNPDAYWLDDYDEVIQTHPLDLFYKSYGPE